MTCYLNINGVDRPLIAPLHWSGGRLIVKVADSGWASELPTPHPEALLHYDPKPIDTAHVKLPPGLKRLTERLAKHTHDVWARKRLDDGWTLGKVRDDAKKQHPNLVPYESLTDDEKDYDRRVTMEALKAIIALGYRIEKGT